jgi:hypothetical protein
MIPARCIFLSERLRRGCWLDWMLPRSLLNSILSTALSLRLISLMDVVLRLVSATTQLWTRIGVISSIALAASNLAVLKVGVFYIRIDVISVVLGSKVFAQEHSVDHMNGLRHSAAAKLNSGCIDSCLWARLSSVAGAPYGGSISAVPPFLSGVDALRTTGQQQFNLLVQKPKSNHMSAFPWQWRLCR